MTETDIARVLTKTIFPYRVYVAVQNVSWGLLPWEADLVVMPRSGYLYEIEIKITIADLRRDQHKYKHRLWDIKGYGSKFRGLWYAMPEQIWQKVEAAPIPDHAGVIVVVDEQRALIVRPITPNRNAEKLGVADQFQLARLGAMRYWTRA